MLVKTRSESICERYSQRRSPSLNILDPDLNVPWSTHFPDPVPGIKTLRDAANFILKLPKSEQIKPHWQAAGEAVMMAAEGRGPLLHARIGMLRALNFGKDKPVRKKQARKYRVL